MAQGLVRSCPHIERGAHVAWPLGMDTDIYARGWGRRCPLCLVRRWFICLSSGIRICVSEHLLSGPALVFAGQLAGGPPTGTECHPILVSSHACSLPSTQSGRQARGGDAVGLGAPIHLPGAGGVPAHSRGRGRERGARSVTERLHMYSYERPNGLHRCGCARCCGLVMLREKAPSTIADQACSPPSPVVGLG